MQKMMFNDKYGLTEAVLNGEKTQTRRIAIFPKTCYGGIDEEKMVTWDCGGNEISINSKYKIGEIVAVAQNYKDILNTGNVPPFLYQIYTLGNVQSMRKLKGFDNKMFVKADLMLHQIQITNIRLEKLQDISDEDCIAEGIEIDVSPFDYGFWDEIKIRRSFSTPREAYASLIDRVSGKGTWESNPYVFVYEFKLIK